MTGGEEAMAVTYSRDPDGSALSYGEGDLRDLIDDKPVGSNMLLASLFAIIVISKTNPADCRMYVLPT